MKSNSEAEVLYTEIKGLRPVAKDTGIIAVADSKTLRAMDRMHGSKDIFRLQWYQKLKFWKREDDLAPVRFTTPDNINEAIEEIQTLCEEEGYEKLLILAGKSIKRLSINVGSEIRRLLIARAPHCTSPLLVERSSTLGDLPLQEYQGQKKGGRQVFWGKHVQVEIDPSTSQVWLPGENRTDGSNADMIRSHLYEMEKSGNGPEGWKNWKAPAAGIVGLLGGGFAGCAKFKSCSGGFTFACKAFSLSAWGTSAQASLTAIGFGVGVGAAAAVAVYFIPWEGLFGWLKDALWTLWQWFSDFFRKLVEIAASFMDSRGHRPRRHQRARTLSKAK